MPTGAADLATQDATFTMEDKGISKELAATPTERRESHNLKQDELERRFSIWSLGGLCLCLMATWEALSSTVAQALLSGGAPCLFYN